MICERNYTNRIEYIDYYRAIGIVMMVMGHIGFGATFDKFIHAFHMPMFFLVSGFLYKRTDSKIYDVLIRKAKSLIVPYFVFGVFQCILYGFIFGFSFEHYYHLLFFNSDGIPIAGALWFLTALFFTDMVFLVCDRYNLLILIPPISVLGCLLVTIWDIMLPWSLNAALVGLGFYYLGDLLKKAKNSRVYKLLFYSAWIIPLSILNVGLIFVNGYVNMRTGRYSIVPLFWINAILSSCILLSLSELFSIKIKSKWLLSIGKNSIVYLCLNQLVITVTKRALGIINTSLSNNSIIVLFVSMPVLFFLAKFISGSKIRFIIGL